jgi:hypothetical protein
VTKRESASLCVASLLALLPAAAARACSDPPAAAVAPVSDLVARTAIVVLATAKDAQELFRVSTVEPKGGVAARPVIRYTFTADETLKGSGPVSFSLEFSAVDPTAAPREATEDFDRHRAPDWQGKGGRIGAVGPDCEIGARFNIGARYLIFVDKPWHVLGFERIAADDDLWLRDVRRRIAEGGH